MNSEATSPLKKQHLYYGNMANCMLNTNKFIFQTYNKSDFI